jgi:hypothetical protein
MNRSARLRDLLVYLTTRVLEDEVFEIHEQEVGHKVFGRPANYDTGSDNIVRVHAAMLRKRLEQYFAEEARINRSSSRYRRATMRRCSANAKRRRRSSRSQSRRRQCGGWTGGWSGWVCSPLYLLALRSI